MYKYRFIERKYSFYIFVVYSLLKSSPKAVFFIYFSITINYFNKLIALPQKRWLHGKTYLMYDNGKD